jgi:GNAT superfamily N-acetyltransferase
LEIRPASAADRHSINALLRRTLNVGDDPRYDRFLEWKHRANPFGSSYEWVATIDDVVVGYRSFLRLELVVDGTVRPAVRAVDTATDPEHHGQGIFRSLTEQGVDHLKGDGVAWVFNTPNDSSRPGYLKMGWSVVGKLPVAVMARSPLALRHLRRARQPAARWSEPCTAFDRAVSAIDHLLDGDAAPPRDATRRWSTNRTSSFLRWRYGLDDLQYRGFSPDESTVVVFRVRQRGPLREAMIADVIRRPGAETSLRLGSATRTILRATGADVAVMSGGRRSPTAIPVGGPQLTWRPVCDERVPTIDQLSFCGGDMELF